jgi:ligand-binding sensor domain-containing protein
MKSCLILNPFSLVFLFLITISTLLTSQSGLKIGQWKSHLAFREGIAVTQSEDKVIYAGARGLIIIDKADLSLSYLAKEDGLSAPTVKIVKYDKSQDMLVVVYNDNNIDLIKGNDIVNLPFIKNNSTIIGSKDINDLFIDQKGKAYFATSFGLLIFNTDKQEFSLTAYTDGLRIQSVTIRDKFIYLGTNNGLFKVANDGSANIADFSSWEKVVIGGGGIQDIISLATKFDRIYVGSDASNEVYASGSNNDQFSLVFTSSKNDDIIKYLSDDGTSIMVGVQKANNAGEVIFLDQNNEPSVSPSCNNLVRYSIEDQSGRIWYADTWDPIRYSLTKTSECRRMSMSGPFTNAAGELTFDKEVAYVAALGITEDYQYTFSNAGFYLFEDNTWTNYSSDILPALQQYSFINVQGIALEPETKNVLISSYWNGVMSVNLTDKSVKHWNKDNSTLQGVVGDELRTRVPYIVFDKDKNLWVSNFGAPKPLAVKTPDDKWYSFSVPSNTSLGDIAFDQQGNKWIAVVGTGNGLLVHSHGANIASASDDKVRYITKNNSEITGNRINCVVVDLDGSVWVGTDAGPVIFDCGDPFSDERCGGNTRKVVVDGIPAPLLRSEDILCIAVDGGNRKWFGTRNGIFVQSPDGSEAIAKYSVDNSPLMDNKVINLKFNGTTGEMFIISSLGIQSLKTESIEAADSHSSNVYAYPNPVRPEYNGPIAIKGLVRDANVKITDINGKLVYETTSVGGQAIWDGSDYNGVKAAAGVYLVFSANTDISKDVDNFVTKILIVK